MGDIWPYLPPDELSVDDLRYWISIQPGNIPDPSVMAAIGMAESSGDIHVINDTRSTGDYSVGAWQINYYGNLYAGRVAQFGTPEQLVRGGAQPQAHAAVVVWREQGYGAWSTYTSGAYRKFLGPGAAQGPPQAPGQQTSTPDTGINPPTEDYSATIIRAAGRLDDVTRTFQSFGDAIYVLKGL